MTTLKNKWKEKKTEYIIGGLMVVVVMAVLLALLAYDYIRNTGIEKDYQHAIELIKAENYEAAEEMFAKLETRYKYEDSENLRLYASAAHSYDIYKNGTKNEEYLDEAISTISEVPDSYVGDLCREIKGFSDKLEAARTHLDYEKYWARVAAQAEQDKKDAEKAEQEKKDAQSGENSSSTASSGGNGFRLPSTSGSTSSSGSSSNSSQSSSSNRYYPEDSYDTGYDDVYMDEDYDIDRYNNDSDYANGVDDALEDEGEDW